MRQQKQLRVACQVLVVALALAAVHAGNADTQERGDGSYTVIGTGEAVHPEKQQQPPQSGGQIKSKAQYTRTALHVARSLDPEAEETVQVRTRTGDVASLIVKRRNRSQAGKDAAASAPPPYPARQAAAPRIAKAAAASSNVRVPAPVNIQSSTVLVKPAAAEQAKKSRSLMKIDAEGIPVIEGVRVPDDEDDKIHTWRNARVINGVLVPNNVTVNATAASQPAAAPPPPPSGFPASLDAAAVKKLAESTAQSPWIPTSPDGANVVAPPLLTPQRADIQEARR